MTDERPACMSPDPDRLARAFAMKYGLIAQPPMTYEEARRLEVALATFLRAALAERQP